MARYPDSPQPIAPYNFRVNRPFVGDGPEWAQQRRSPTMFSIYEADLSYRGKSWAQVMVLHSFFESVNGAAGRFTFVDFNGVGVPDSGTHPGVPWKNLFVRQGTGAGTGPFDLPTYSIKQSMTTVSASLTAGANTVTPVSMAEIIVGVKLTVVNADGTSGEVVTVTAATATTFDATFASNKASSWLVNAPLVFEDGVAKTTKWDDAAPGAGNYGIKVGTGTDGIDSLYAGTTPGSGVIVTIDAMCRRAERKAIFASAKNPFTLNVPANYYQGPVTILGLRK